MNVCSKCHRQLDAQQFYSCSKMTDGKVAECKDCTKTRVYERRLANIDQVREADRARNRTENRRGLYRAWKKKNPEKVKAHNAVNNAIRHGRLARLSCWCGELGEAHHPDYSKPLDVVWLCKKHHEEMH